MAVVDTLWSVNSPMRQGGVRTLTPEEVGVAYQPIVDVATGAVFAHEVLARCTREEYRNPAVLFQAAEQEKACGRLGRMVRDTAFVRGADFPLFVNLHPSELSERWLVRPDDPLNFHDHAVFLEITETAAFSHFELCRGALTEVCKRTGAKLVVDDYGAGHSNVLRVVELEPAVVKLDLALVRNIHQSPKLRAVVRHTVALCEELGSKVVAEGIEQLEELQCVIDLGVHYAQGYFLARPSPLPPDVDWPIR